MTKAQKTFEKLAEMDVPTAIAGAAGAGLLGYGGYKAYKGRTASKAAQKASKLKGAGKVGAAIAGLAGLGALGYKGARKYAPEVLSRQLDKGYDIAAKRAKKPNPLSFDELVSTNLNSRARTSPLSTDEVKKVLTTFKSSNPKAFPRATIQSKWSHKSPFAKTPYEKLHDSRGRIIADEAVGKFRFGDFSRGKNFSKDKTLRENYNTYKELKSKIPGEYRTLKKDLKSIERAKLQQLMTN